MRMSSHGAPDVRNWGSAGAIPGPPQLKSLKK